MVSIGAARGRESLSKIGHHFLISRQWLPPDCYLPCRERHLIVCWGLHARRAYDWQRPPEARLDGCCPDRMRQAEACQRALIVIPVDFVEDGEIEDLLR